MMHKPEGQIGNSGLREQPSRSQESSGRYDGAGTANVTQVQ